MRGSEQSGGKCQRSWQEKADCLEGGEHVMHNGHGVAQRIVRTGEIEV